MPSYSFSKNRRLLKASDYQEVFDRNKLKVAHPKLLLLAKQSDHVMSRLGVVVGKKNIPTAVGRNRVKRLVRETFRQTEFPIALDIIFLARKDADKLSRTELSLLLKQSWGRLLQRCEGLDINNG